jgi:threonine dehydrogenase-like Zn-dependent dehydrogenase
MAHYGPIPVPADAPAHRSVLLADVLATSWQGVIQAGVAEGDTVGVFGLGPIGQICCRFALRKGAHRVFRVDVVAERLSMAEQPLPVSSPSRHDQYLVYACQEQDDRDQQTHRSYRSEVEAEDDHSDHEPHDPGDEEHTKAHQGPLHP